MGISETFGQFLGTSTVTLPLSELQTITGSSGIDPATLITVTTEEGRNVESVQAAIERDHPDLSVQTNQEQLQGLLLQHATVITGAGILVILAIISGVLLTATLQALYVYQNREEFRMLGALGVSRTTIICIVGVRGFTLGALGAIFGVALTIPATPFVNFVVASISGFDGLVIVSPLALASGAVIAIFIGTMAGICAVRLLPINPVQ
ncbi:MAG: FtsX-like permease family protein [Natrialbaceae archaeon]|nr:FtsX-like permease family protein [Natrialbaceae archaeon]